MKIRTLKKHKNTYLCPSCNKSMKKSDIQFFEDQILHYCLNEECRKYKEQYVHREESDTGWKK